MSRAGRHFARRGCREAPWILGRCGLLPPRILYAAPCVPVRYREQCEIKIEKKQNIEEREREIERQIERGRDTESERQRGQDGEPEVNFRGGPRGVAGEELWGVTDGHSEDRGNPRGKLK